MKFKSKGMNGQMLVLIRCEVRELHKRRRDKLYNLWYQNQNHQNSLESCTKSKEEKRKGENAYNKLLL